MNKDKKKLILEGKALTIESDAVHKIVKGSHKMVFARDYYLVVEELRKFKQK